MTIILLVLLSISISLIYLGFRMDEGELMEVGMIGLGITSLLFVIFSLFAFFGPDDSEEHKDQSENTQRIEFKVNKSNTITNAEYTELIFDRFVSKFELAPEVFAKIANETEDQLRKRIKIFLDTKIPDTQEVKIAKVTVIPTIKKVITVKDQTKDELNYKITW